MNAPSVTWPGHDPRAPGGLAVPVPGCCTGLCAHHLSCLTLALFASVRPNTPSHLRWGRVERFKEGMSHQGVSCRGLGSVLTPRLLPISPKMPLESSVRVHQPRRMSAGFLGDMQHPSCPSPGVSRTLQTLKMKVHLPKGMKLWPLLRGQ